MDTFLIKSAEGSGTLEFYDRSPSDIRRPIVEFSVRVADLDMSASVRASVNYYTCKHVHPAGLLAEMAERWKGWPGELEWVSMERECRLACSMDRVGHVLIRTDLRRLPRWELSWSVTAEIMVEAGQLDELARRAGTFFGVAGPRPR